MQKHFQTPSFLVLVVLPYYYRGIQSHSGASCTTGLDAGDSLIPRVVQSCANDICCFDMFVASTFVRTVTPGTSGTPWDSHTLRSKSCSPPKQVQRWREMDLAGNEQCVEVRSFRLERPYFRIFFGLMAQWQNSRSMRWHHKDF